MAFEIQLPKLGTNMVSATVNRWLKSVGDTVAAGETLVEVETDKATVDLPSEVSGVVRVVFAAEGQVVPVTMPLAIIAKPDEDIADMESTLRRRWKDSRSEKPATHLSRVMEGWNQSVSASAAAGTSAATPAARRLARERGVDLVDLAKSVSNRVMEESDVQAYLEAVPTVIYGAGLGAAQILDVTRFVGTLRMVGLIDDNRAIWGREIRGIPVLGGGEKLSELIRSGAVRAAIFSFHSEIRRKIHLRVEKEFPTLRFPAVVHPHAYIGYGVKIEDGALVEAGAVIGTEAVIRRGAIVDMGAIVSHHCDVGPFCHLAPGAKLSGVVNLREHVLVGAGAVVSNTVTVGENTVITPGAAVSNDLPPDVVADGVPARVIGRSKRGGGHAGKGTS